MDAMSKYINQPQIVKVEIIQIMYLIILYNIKIINSISRKIH